MRPAVHFDERRTAFHMPSQADCQILLTSAAASNCEVEPWDVLKPTCTKLMALISE